MNSCPHLTGLFEIVRYTRELAASRPVLRDGEALGIGGPNNVCEVDLECLSAFERIWGLHIQDASIFDLDALRRWPDLRYLAIDAEKRPLDLRMFTKLEWLIIVDWWKKLTLPLASTPIRRFAVWRLAGDDLSAVPAWRDLRILELVRARATSMAGIEQFGQIEHVGLMYMRRLTTVSALASRPTLRSLHFESCPNVEDWVTLRGCTGLRELVVVGCRIPSLRFLDDMPPLDSVRLIRTYVDDGDMEPLARMKHAVFTQRRGYSHSEHEIAEMIRARHGSGSTAE